MPLTLETSIEKLPFIGPKNLPKLKNLGIKTVRDLLWHFPSKYEDFSNTAQVAYLKAGENAHIHGEVVSIENFRSWKKRMNITTAVIADKTDRIRAVWFNKPYVVEQLKKGTIVSIAGKTSIDKKGLYFPSPTYEKISGLNSQISRSMLIHTKGLVAKYPETKGVTSKYLRFLIKNAISRLSPPSEHLPEEIIKKYLFPKIGPALKEIHFPSSQDSAQKAKERFAFDELLLFQLKALRSRRNLTKLRAPRILFDKNIIRRLVKSLPFKLTTDQRISTFEILKDIERPYPMNRLLNGDVGSGKTVVALIAAYQTVQAGYKSVFMAPTEILAQQHFQTIKKILKDPAIKVGLLTSNTKNKKKLIDKIANGSIDIIIGTHALIQKKVKFKNLGLVIVDEQHRFGVKQRAALLKNGGANLTPHFLSMTATPIPRTLALTIYGDLDISIIKEKPKNRQKIITKVITPLEKNSAYNFIDKEIEKNRQVFLVCPRIESPDINIGDLRQAQGKPGSQMSLIWQEVKAVKEEYEKISKKIFPHRRVAMLHGKMPVRSRQSGHVGLNADEKLTKQEIMDKFKNGEIDILVSTSVIEVGVDVPNATIMAIENAERFGLAQLHQFRGRVGRDKYQSYCLLFCGTKENLENKRLKALTTCDDGFELAEKDLQIRGAGQFFGNRQSGMTDLAMASLANIDLIKRARTEARLFLKKDPSLDSYQTLKKKLDEFQRLRHFE